MTDISILATPTWLEWDPKDWNSLEELYSAYHDVIAGAIGAGLAALQRLDPELSSSLLSVLECLDESAVREVVESPASSYYFLFQREKPRLGGEYLRRSLEAQARRAGKSVSSPTREVWTSRGDFVWRDSNISELIPAGERRLSYSSYLLANEIPVDFRSPNSLRISLGGQHPQVDLGEYKNAVAADAVALYTPEEESVICERLAETYSLIQRSSDHVARFVARFTRTLCVRVDPDNPEVFSSGSDGQFPGRTTLINPDRMSIPVLADALVHEAIHAVLYMQERREAWVSDSRVYFGEGFSTVSPWSGRTLTPRQFMQACFVWFGLRQFWALPGSSTTFGENVASYMANIASRGFFTDRLVGLAESWSAHTSRNLLDAIEEVQRRVALQTLDQ